MTLERLRDVLNHLNIREVSRGCGVHENTLYRIARGGEARYSTVMRVVAYLQSKGLLNG
jgi:predicted transcriptional regulator